MRFVSEAAFLIILCCLFFLAWVIATNMSKPRPGKEWEVKRVDKAHDQCTEFWLVKAPESAELVGRANWSRDDYSDKLIELQEAAEEKMYTWNSADKVLKS